MAMWHLDSKRKPTGGRLRKNRKKKSFQRGTNFLETKIGANKTKTQATTGGNKKTRLLSAEKANIFDTKTKKIRSVKIISVEENKANPHYIRRNILTKGALIKTELGTAKVTSSPGQHGVINAVLLESEKKK